jgi:hypothetical protein
MCLRHMNSMKDLKRFIAQVEGLCAAHVSSARADTLWRWLSQQEDKKMPPVGQSSKTPRFTVNKLNARAQHHPRSSLSCLLSLWYCHIVSLCQLTLLEANDGFLSSPGKCDNATFHCLRLNDSAMSLSNDDPACRVSLTLGRIR